MNWTDAEIAALAKQRGLTRLTPEHLARWRELADRSPDALALRREVERKKDQPAYGPVFFEN